MDHGGSDRSAEPEPFRPRRPSGLTSATATPSRSRSCTGLGTDPHWCIRSGEWILDPAAGQWGATPVLVFREGSDDDWHGPGREGLAEISEGEIIARFRDWVGPEAGSALLLLAGLEHLSPALWA